MKNFRESLKVQSRNNIIKKKRRAGLIDLAIPVFKKVTKKDLRAVVSKKLNKLGKFYAKFKENKLPVDFLPKIDKIKTDPVSRYWDINQQKEFKLREMQEQMLSLNKSNTETKNDSLKKNSKIKDDYPGLPLIMSKLMIRKRGKMAKEFKLEMDEKDKLRQNVSQDLEKIEKEAPLFGMNYEQAERGYRDKLFHIEKR